jgi:hypothetical protein
MCARLHTRPVGEQVAKWEQVGQELKRKLEQAVEAQAATEAALRKSEAECAELRRAHATLGERIDAMTREVSAAAHSAPALAAEGIGGRCVPCGCSSGTARQRWRSLSARRPRLGCSRRSSSLRAKTSLPQTRPGGSRAHAPLGPAVGLEHSLHVGTASLPPTCM